MGFNIFGVATQAITRVVEQIVDAPEAIIDELEKSADRIFEGRR